MEPVTRRAMIAAIGGTATVGLLTMHVERMGASVASIPASAETAEWDQLMAERDSAKATFDAYTGDDDDRHDQLCDLYCEAESRLMAMPAPNAAALRWKLDKLLEPEAAGSTASWSRAYVAQTTRDIARLLGGEA